MISDPLMLLIALLTAHFFFDYAGQGDFMAKAKNVSSPIPGVPWGQVLSAHAFIHGGAVALLTGVWWLLLLEAAVHFFTDLFKCENRISYNVDQAVHIACKFLWVGLLILIGKI